MRSIILAIVVTGMGACSEEESGQAAANSVCDSVSDCADGTTCLVVDGNGRCRAICEVSTTECGGSASCGAVGVLSVDVCQPPAPEPTPDDPPSAAEQPRIPCASDAECDALEAGAICAGYKGERDCTLACAIESDCTMPAVGGVRMDFLTCITDESDATRKACLPDAACFSNPMSCIDFGAPILPFP